MDKRAGGSLTVGGFDLPKVSRRAETSPVSRPVSRSCVTVGAGW